MCFSASVSFGAGVVLSIIGVASIKKVQQPSQIPFASIPFIFAIQQISEGFLWITLSHAEYSELRFLPMYTFLFFAQFLWPTWVPVSLLLLEKEEKRKTILRIIVIIGVVVSLYHAYSMLSHPIHAEILGYHISYFQPHLKKLSLYFGLLYAIATILPSFTSSIKWMWSLGIAVIISYIITAIFYSDYVVSVWCFFASIISFTAYYIMLQIKNSNSN
jgi:hypothetical protein